MKKVFICPECNNEIDCVELWQKAPYIAFIEENGDVTISKESTCDFIFKCPVCEKDISNSVHK